MTVQSPNGDPVEIRTTDATDLQAVVFPPKGPSRRAVLVAGGLGIPQQVQLA